MGAVTVIDSFRGQVHADEKSHARSGVAIRVTVIAMDPCERKRIPCTSPRRTKPKPGARDSQYIAPRRHARTPCVVASWSSDSRISRLRAIRSSTSRCQCRHHFTAEAIALGQTRLDPADVVRQTCPTIHVDAKHRARASARNGRRFARQKSASRAARSAATTRRSTAMRRSGPTRAWQSRAHHREEARHPRPAAHSNRQAARGSAESVSLDSFRIPSKLA
ncbi:MAG: hypothetical protein GAK33_04205 [Burkholderia lata]|uniref:Uncharacterized protein n=1 Tax=Burkholderia lata (strain ATCC 17760 / DSM 23089 / LMG 22485 / NCIMB 9086 / R18194 / 383) TaxID=482957 RepID=A0A833UA04_BURL3|nr:MAG: hypothetical protein GAK33_04205 [Burkholderia lata]